MLWEIMIIIDKNMHINQNVFSNSENSSVIYTIIVIILLVYFVQVHS